MVLTSDRVLSLTGPGQAMDKADLCRIEGEPQPMESVERFLINRGDKEGGGGGMSIDAYTFPTEFVSR